MPSTSVHLPRDLVTSLDALAARRRVSRNRLILEACERLLQEEAGEWPQGFFANNDLSAADLRELRAAGKALEAATRRLRRHPRRDTCSLWTRQFDAAWPRRSLALRLWGSPTSSGTPST